MSFDLLAYARVHRLRVRNLHDGYPVRPTRQLRGSPRIGYRGGADRHDAIIGRDGYVDASDYGPGRIGFAVFCRSARALRARLRALSAVPGLSVIQEGDTEAAGHALQERIAEVLAALRPYRRREAPAGAGFPALQSTHGMELGGELGSERLSRLGGQNAQGGPRVHRAPRTCPGRRNFSNQPGPAPSAREKRENAWREKGLALYNGSMRANDRVDVSTSARAACAGAIQMVDRTKTVLVAACLLTCILNPWPARGDCPEAWLPGEGMPGLDAHARANTVYDDGTGPALYVGGVFSVAGTQTAAAIAKWDGIAWHTLSSGMSGATQTAVCALTVYKGELVAGGAFTTAGGTPVNGIARWDGAQWRPLGSGIGGSGPAVLALTVYNDELIAAGPFTKAGAIDVNCIARWDGTQWQPLGSGVSEGVSGSAYVHALAVYDGELVVGGNFTKAGDVSVSHIARWSGSEWQTLGSGMNTNYGYVHALGVCGTDLIAGGEF